MPFRGGCCIRQLSYEMPAHSYLQNFQRLIYRNLFEVHLLSIRSFCYHCILNVDLGVRSLLLLVICLTLVPNHSRVGDIAGYISCISSRCLRGTSVKQPAGQKTVRELTIVIVQRLTLSSVIIHVVAHAADQSVAAACRPCTAETLESAAMRQTDCSQRLYTPHENSMCFRRKA